MAKTYFITFGGLLIPIAAAMNDAAIRRVIGDLPPTWLEAGVHETMRRFAELRAAGRLDTTDIEAGLSLKKGGQT